MFGKIIIVHMYRIVIEIMQILVPAAQIVHVFKLSGLYVCHIKW